MNYAIWQLDFTDVNNGTGPEQKILELGSIAEAAWIDGVAEDAGTILGYLSSPADEIELSKWKFQNITQEEALDFCLFINPEAYLLPNGRIGAPSDREF